MELFMRMNYIHTRNLVIQGYQYGYCRIWCESCNLGYLLMSCRCLHLLFHCCIYHIGMLPLCPQFQWANMQKQRLTDWPTDTFHVSDPDATTSIQKEAIHVYPMINRQKRNNYKWIWLPGWLWTFTANPSGYIPFSLERAEPLATRPSSGAPAIAAAAVAAKIGKAPYDVHVAPMMQAPWWRCWENSREMADVYNFLG